MEDVKKSFESSKKNMLSGHLNFSSDYISYFQLYEAVTQWVNEDKNVLSAALRSGGGFLSLDFRYDMSDLSNKVIGSVLHTIFKPKFKELLGGDYLQGWDYGEPTYVIK